MKTRTTEKHIRNTYGNENIYKVGYCNMQTLLRFYDPVYYTAGVYGWNADYYIFDDKVISTGYRPIGKNSVEYEVCEKYEKAAREICRKTFNYQEQKEEMDKLMDKFKREVF